MPIIKILPHASLCPEGKEFSVGTGTVLCRAMLDHEIAIEHACELSCACTTCHVIVREGFSSLEASEEKEDDMLDKAWGLSAFSRLSCQMIVADTDLTIEIPKYTINHAREENH
jgi:ferredoxin, 2Fe-2S